MPQTSAMRCLLQLPTRPFISASRFAADGRRSPPLGGRPAGSFESCIGIRRSGWGLGGEYDPSRETKRSSPQHHHPLFFLYLPTGTWISVTHSSGGIDSLHLRRLPRRRLLPLGPLAFVEVLRGPCRELLAGASDPIGPRAGDHRRPRAVRHLMHTAHLLWAVAQLLHLQNWIAGPAFLVASVALYVARIPRVEEMMEDEFGEEPELVRRELTLRLSKFQTHPPGDSHVSFCISPDSSESESLVHPSI